jgi:hypothetical protein
MLAGGSEARQHGEGRTITTLDDVLTRTIGRLPMSAALLLGAAVYAAIGLACAKLGIELVDNRELVRRIENVRATEPCPICATPMLLDRSARGWWLRCPGWTDGCAGKRDLGAHPGRALDLLLAD